MHQVMVHWVHEDNWAAYGAGERRLSKQSLHLQELSTIPHMLARVHDMSKAGWVGVKGDWGDHGAGEYSH